MSSFLFCPIVQSADTIYSGNPYCGVERCLVSALKLSNGAWIANLCNCSQRCGGELRSRRVGQPIEDLQLMSGELTPVLSHDFRKQAGKPVMEKSPSFTYIPNAI